MGKRSLYPVHPKRQVYDVVIVGGAMIGASVAWYLASNPDFNGKVLVVERDPTYANSGTGHTNSCIRQQFSNAINIQISRYAIEFMRDFSARMEDAAAPEIHLHSFGYLYLAASENAAEVLRENQQVQAACGAATRLYSQAELAEAFPFYHLDDIVLGSHNPVDEGYFDGNTLFDWWRRKAREFGVEFIDNTVVSMARSGGKVRSVTLASGQEVAVGLVVNASGTRADATARMAGLGVPVEPRKRYTFVFEAQNPLPCDLPLTVDPCGVHMRTDGRYYMAGSPPAEGDPAVDPNDFTQDFSLWQEKVWPAIAHRIPQFSALKLIQSWAGNYAYNTLDQNAIVGPHPDVANFLFVNGFSGHGFQQAPAMGRGISELVVYGGYRTLDLSPLSVRRVLEGRPLREKAVI